MNIEREKERERGRKRDDLPASKVERVLKWNYFLQSASFDRFSREEENLVASKVENFIK
jgi:hypothetical protein